MTFKPGDQRRQVTVFGGSGFIGRHLVRRLAARGDIVRVAVRDTLSAGFLKPFGDVGQIVPLAADINNQVAVETAVRDADCVVNLVGILNPSGFGSRRATFESVHVAGARQVAIASARAKVKHLVQISAVGADPVSSSVYARTKAEGEAAVRDAFPAASIARPSIVFGPEDDFFNRFASLLPFTACLPVLGSGRPRLEWPVKGDGLPSLDIYGGGGPLFQPVYVGDVADAIIGLIDPASVQTGKPLEAEGKVFELGGPRVYSFKALMELLMAVTGRRRLLAPVPLWAASTVALFLECLPKPLLTRDQVRLLYHDNVVGKKALKLSDLGIDPAAAEIILPTYLARFREGGSFKRA
ncbi:MAG: complex I NDUFA9 subunit family protein [Rhodospirillaceae bacterium]|jgi:uncharacterized protein YbjT (DUF2867 family)|nr:complex I NDUFA9 subunit family protein [Rhodospirillaceae bacterium]MBT5751540.1 complex I NDUFA9 subunit family protein [Rhodospirillaceae bacterium]